MSRILKEMTAPVAHWRLVWLLGWRESALAHRRSLLGVFWTPLQTLALIAFILAVFGLDAGGEDFPIHVAVGVVVYQFATTIMIQGANAMVGNSGLLLNIPLPPTVYVWRLLTKASINLALDLPIVIGVFIWLGIMPDPLAILHAVGAILFAAVAFIGFSIGLAALAVRIRDVVPFVAATSRILFFATPIFWRMGEDTWLMRQLIHDFNPIARFLQLVRDPLMGMPLTMEPYLACLAFFTAFWIAGFVLYSIVRPRLAAWL